LFDTNTAISFTTEWGKKRNTGKRE